MVTHNDYKILMTLNSKEAFSKLVGLTIKQIEQITSLSNNKIRTTLMVLNFMNYVKEGIAEHNAKTFYITQEGIDKLKEK